ncbi:putative ATPase/DNA-binding CsgD family transcriptional regulator/GAF domain-containing protein [Fontibacillus solani]|uniref:Putative ATPase/DNA-binding CsgD family transcriptional regulator/GAF domain-containing protein n=1 Tax=Fontibacillus solani TaxID=1572857 RepID=A0A7W3SRE5_9BACL|nr:AAA family ATPase [Fontibacillus solani]MBA9084871.1 putative ATPase/DNA-binding CsgD family transcriptional regulator/GAF domain-containing protein [Fontibacillus solani]
MKENYPINDHAPEFLLEQKSSMSLREIMNNESFRMQIRTIDTFLSLARAIAACVGKLHQQHILHLDLRPELIHILSDERTVQLIDSGYAIHRSKHGYIRPSDGIMEAGLPYCAPENTGRMLRTIDERSDLYSLGVIFYEMLTGRLPFLADNPLEWVYMHLAQSPSPLTNHREDLPEGLESIILKLLEKNPDKRYQNIGSLIADLDKVGRSQLTLFIDPELHGRDYEITVLTQAFYSTCFGSTEIVYVSGEAGIGKTSLIDEVFHKIQQSQHFFYITGKFEQISKESPYLPIIQAFRGLMRHLLGERQDQSELWRLKLQEALGNNANVIASIIPEVSLLLGEIPFEEELPANESKKRFIYVFRKFVQALTSKEHPLVLFIDDLQWADDSSLQLIHALLSDPECQYLMFVCAHRHLDTDQSKLPGYETDGSVTEQATVKHIHLSPLSLEQMNQIVVETLNSDAHTAMSLTELLYHKSEGNPFHFKQILLHLQDDDILKYNRDNRCWQWNLGQIIEQEPSYSIHDLMEHRLYRLPNIAQELLFAAACAGSTFDPELINVVVNYGIQDMNTEWSLIEAEGMIVPFESDKYRFTHDSIQKLIYSQIEDDAKQSIHSRIGRCLRENDDGTGENSFEVVNHLNRGSEKITDMQHLLLLIQLNLDAGNRAKTSSAYDVALAYFRKGVELLPADYWESDFELSFELHAQQAECEYLCGNYAKSDQEIVFLLHHARNPVERSRVHIIKIMQFINQGKYLEGTDLGLKSLREHHIFISPNPSNLMLLIESKRIELLLRNKYDKLKHLEEMSDREQITAMNLILAIIPSTFFTNKKVFLLLMCRAIQLTLKYGNTPVSAAVYSAFGMFMGNALGKYDKGYLIGKIGVELSEQYNINSIKSKSYTMFGGVLCQFAGYPQEVDDYLSKALRCGMDSGDYVFASYAIGAHVNSLYPRASLVELSRTITDYMAVLDTTNDEFVKQNFYLYQQFILALQGMTDAPDSFNSEGFDEEEFLHRIRKEETSSTTFFQYNTYKTQLCYLLGRYEDAIHWAREAERYKIYATHLPHLPECLFYQLLAALSLAESSDSKIRDRSKKKLERDLRHYGKWVKWNPTNYQPRSHLLQAEYARVFRQYFKAEQMYDAAIREAREQDDFQVTSLTGELAASHYWGRGKRKSALFYLQMSVDGYKQWGIPAKVAELEERLLHWQREEVSQTSESPAIRLALSGTELASEYADTQKATNSLDSVDLAAILKTTEAISNQPNIDAMLAEIMDTIIKYAGASKGALLTGNDDELYIQAYVDAETPAFASPVGMKDSSLLPEGLIRYVFRTHEDVHYYEEEESWLIHNPYIAKHRPGSALCIPVAVHGAMLGVLYLENRLASGVFASDHKAVLLAIASNAILMCVLQGSSEGNPLSPDLMEAGAAVSDHIIEEPLTERELEVLALLAAGLSNKEIADHLIIAIGTVKVHVKNIFAKLKVNRRTKAIAQAKELKLLG